MIFFRDISPSLAFEEMPRLGAMSMKPGLDTAAIKESVRVQDDLFRHVNGKWLDETDIPEDKAIYGSFHMLADDSELAVRELI
ncbi:MAG: hypothetical protein VW500_04630, partial [Aquiluna sp.]